ncbi:hypothetical protein [Haladaptatus sp.]|uniref:hypothetical protein n=1 Tax=Haladaptatus sp. TaxID=1973141 RepID=UPI003C3E3737
MVNEHEAGMPRWSARVDDSVLPQRTKPSGDVLVFTRDFFPNVPFRIVAQLPALITVTILDEPPDGVQVISQPDEYNGYVITYDFHRTPIFVFLFSRRYLPTSDRYRFGDDATYFSSNLDLLEVSAETVL